VPTACRPAYEPRTSAGLTALSAQGRLACPAGPRGPWLVAGDEAHGRLATFVVALIKGVFGCMPRMPRHATHLAPQVRRPNRPPHLRRGVAPSAGNQTALNCAYRANVRRPPLLPKCHVVVLTTRRAVPAQPRPFDFHASGYKLLRVRAAVALLSTPPAIRTSTRKRKDRVESEETAYPDLTVIAAAARRPGGHVELEELHHVRGEDPDPRGERFPPPRLRFASCGRGDLSAARSFGSGGAGRAFSLRLRHAGARLPPLSPPRARHRASSSPSGLAASSCHSSPYVRGTWASLPASPSSSGSSSLRA
jgi:hypothetical protein